MTHYYESPIEYQSVTSSFCNLSIQTLKPHRETETVALRTCAGFQIAGTTESEDREV